MKLTTRRKLKYYSNYFFLRQNFFFLFFASLICYAWFRHSYSTGSEAAKPVQATISLFALGFFAIVLAISLATCLTPWINFLFKKRILENRPEERRDIIKIYFDSTHFEAGLVKVRIEIQGIRVPAMGFAKVNLVFDDYLQTEDIFLNEVIRTRGKRGYKETGIKGVREIALPTIRDYRIKSSFIHFEDMFHIFSLPYREIENMGIFTTPASGTHLDFECPTEQTKDPVTKVYANKIVAGEYLNYKKFEPGDDLRRLVWKIYAKNRELVVRIPDRIHPYASHVDVLVTFYNQLHSDGEDELSQIMLDYYKDRIRQVIDSIVARGFTVRLTTDQQIQTNYQLNEHERLLYQISSSSWQNEFSVASFMDPRTGTQAFSGPKIVFFSSLCPVDDLMRIFPIRAESCKIFWFQVSSLFQKSEPGFAWKKLFLFEQSGPMRAARRKLGGQKYRRFIAHNEMSIQNFVAGSNLKVTKL
ncbi:DUF58 domain-containing protein [candidate division KSB1 bacterium]|nr:DUF58 domain-containing protein [candidate division KSB1 bacterium]